MLTRRFTNGIRLCRNATRQFFLDTKEKQPCDDYTLIAGSPLPDIVQPEIPLYQYVGENISKWHNHISIECSLSGVKYTYGELFENSKRLGSSLKKLGLKKGSCIGICLPNVPEFPIAYLGSMNAGLVVHSIDFQCSLVGLSLQIKGTGADYIICSPTHLNALKEVKRVLNKDIKVICTRSLDGRSTTRNEECLRFEDLIDSSLKHPPLTVDNLDLNETALITYSSGITTNPRGICLTNKSLTANLEQIAQFSKIVETHGTHQDVVPAVIPFSHSYGHGILMASLRMGAKIISNPKPEQSSLLNTLKESKNVVLFLVPQMVKSLGDASILTPKHFTGVREIVAETGSCFKDLENIRKNTNATISQTYGATEMSSIISWNLSNDVYKDYPLSGTLAGSTQCKIVCPETGIIQEKYISNEICLKGPQMMKGYLNDQEGTAAVIDSEGWLHTGDIGYLDDLGYLHVENKLDDLINIHGCQVSLTKLENIIKMIPGVSDVGVVGSNNQGIDEKGVDEKLVAFVKTESGATLTAQDIMTFVATRVYKYKHLSSVRFVHDIPTTFSGKIIKRKLKKQLRRFEEYLV